MAITIPPPDCVFQWVVERKGGDHMLTIFCRVEDGKVVERAILESTGSIPDGWVHATETPRAVARRNQPDYVYVARCNDGSHKIGHTTNLKHRKAQTKVLEYVHLIEGTRGRVKYAKHLEDRLHLYFQDKRVEGECFMLSADDITYIKTNMADYDSAWEATKPKP